MLGFLGRWFGRISDRVREGMRIGVRIVREPISTFRWERGKQGYIRQWKQDARQTLKLYHKLKKFARVREHYYGDETMRKMGDREMWSVRLHFVDPVKGQVTVDVALRYGEAFDFKKVLKAATPEAAEALYPGDPNSSSKVRAAYVGHVSSIQRYIPL